MSVRMHGNIAVIKTTNSMYTIKMDGIIPIGYSPDYRPTDEGLKGIPYDPLAIPYSFWGPDNLFPQRAMEDVKAIPSLKAGLGFKTRLVYANGPMAFKRKTDETDGSETIIPVTDNKDFNAFMKNSVNRNYFRMASMSANYFFNIFPELVLNKAGNKVLQLRCLKPAYCRWGKIDPYKGYSDWLYYSANWDRSWYKWDDMAPVLDPIDPLGDLKNRQDSFNYIYPSAFPSMDNSYYAEADWNSARVAGWTEIAKQVPFFKQAMFKNQITIKWHIEIPYEYWSITYKGYDALSIEKQKEIRETELDELQKFLSGVENSNKAFISHFGRDKKTGKDLSGWKITQLDDKMKDGHYIPDSNQATQEILAAIGLDASLPGWQLSGDGKMGARTGGSDKREAWMIATALARFERDIIFEPLYLIRDYNGWDSELEFGARDIVLQTLDKNPTGQTKSVNN